MIFFNFLHIIYKQEIGEKMITNCNENCYNWQYYLTKSIVFLHPNLLFC